MINMLQPPIPGAPATLGERAEQINRLFAEVNNAARALVYRRGELGRELLAARSAVEEEHGPGHWEAWCQENIHRSQGDIRKLMALAAAPDPVAAAAQEREKARVGMAEQRANVSAVGPAAPHLRLVPQSDPADADEADPVQATIAVLDALSETHRSAVLAHYWAKLDAAPRTRDTQQSAAYAWERIVYADHFAEAPLSEDQTREYVVSVASELGIPAPPVSFTVRDGSSTAAYASRGTINFGKQSTQRVIILHELAHILTPNAEAHGPEWVACYAALVERYLDAPAQAALNSRPEVPGRTTFRKVKPGDTTGWTEITMGYDDDDPADEYDEAGEYDESDADEYAGSTHWE